MDDLTALSAARAELMTRASALLDAAEREERRFTSEEAAEFDSLLHFAAELLERVRRIEHEQGPSTHVDTSASD